MPFSTGKARAWLHAAGVVLSESEAEAGHRMRVRWTARQKDAFSRL